MGPFQKLNVPTMAVIAVALPVVAYFLGTFVNPQGWMSQEPLVIIMPLIGFWPITLAVLVAIIILAARKSTRKHFRTGVMPVLVLLSIAYSIYLFYAVSTAPQDEFTE